MFPINDNWIIDNLENAFNVWNEKLTELWSIVAESPQTFRGGDIWNLMVDINGGVKAIAYGLLIIFTAISIFGSAMNFRELRRPEMVLRHFIRFVAAKAAITYTMDLLLLLSDIFGGVVHNVAAHMGGISGAMVTLPDEIRNSLNDLTFIKSIPLWLVTLLGSLFVTALSFILIMTVYARFFRLYMKTAMAPIPLSAFAGEATANHGKSFIKGYIAVCLEGVVVVLACLIFGAFTSSPPTFTGSTPFVQTFSYVAEAVFNMLLLVGLIKASDRVVKEIFGL